MANDKCPFCGADLDQDHANPHYLCESGDEGHGVEQSDLCLTRCELAAAKKELAELKERHKRLVRIARTVEGLLRCHAPGCRCSLVELREAIESEANNG